MATFSGVRLDNPVLAPQDPDRFSAAGRTYAVVGGTGGLGRAIARFLAARGARVIVVGQTFRDAGVDRIEFLQADLTTMAEGRRIGRALPAEALDAVVLTTGIFAGPAREVTSEGIERDLAVSYLSRVAVLDGMLGRLGTARTEATLRPRVFVMGYPGLENAGAVDDWNSERGYRPFAVHMNTVAGNEALVLDLARKHPELGVYGLNPGLIKTDIRSNALGGRESLRFKLVEWFIGLWTPTPERYAERVAPLLLAPELEGHSGIHLDQKGRPIRPSAVMTEAHVARIVAESEKLLSRALGEPPAEAARG